MKAERRMIVLGDVHLTTKTPRAVGRDLARLLAAHPGERVVACGDLFDVSADLPDAPPHRAMAAALDAHPEARGALARHLDLGGELLLVAGNHDAFLGAPGAPEALATALGVTGAARERIAATPWFVRDQGLHIEHGHLYDEDNAPEHPLVDGEPSLGVHFVRSFIAPTGAFAYLEATDDTPLRLFLSAFRWYGPRGPYVVHRYFHAAFEAMARSGPLYRAHHERGLGDALMDAFALQAGVSRDVADAVLAQAATSTLRDTRATVSRLYFDRVVATLATTAGITTLAAGRRSTSARAAGASLLAVGLGWLAATWLIRFDRFGGTVPERLRAGAARVRAATGASAVVLGHAHREALEDGYANTGSFAFPGKAPGRPYLAIEPGPGPRIERLYLPRDGSPRDEAGTAGD